jgi:hypothetical protein
MTEHEAVASLFGELCKTATRWMKKNPNHRGMVLLTVAANFVGWTAYILCKDTRDYAPTLDKVHEGSGKALAQFLVDRRGRK